MIVEKTFNLAKNQDYLAEETFEVQNLNTFCTKNKQSPVVYERH